MKQENLGQHSVSKTLLSVAATLLYVTSATVGDYNCLDPKSPLNGHYSSSGYPVALHYECDGGFRLFGPHMQVCSKNGTWTPSPAPTCSDQCIKPEIDRQHGVAKVQNYSGYLQLTLQCFDGYAITLDNLPQKKLQLYCESGYWTIEDAEEGFYGRVPDDVLVCEPWKQCDSPPNIDNGEKRLSQGGTRVSYSCDSGYDVADSSHQTLVCRDGAWIGTWPTCVPETTCPAPEGIPNGKFTVYNNDYEMQELPYYTTKYLYGYYVVYSCNYGYRLVGISDVTCGYEGWLHSPPKCVPKVPKDPTQGVRCPSLPNIQNGLCVCDTKSDLSLCKPFYEGQHIECVCEKGYKLFGESILTCKRTGDWDWDMPTCRKEEATDTTSRSSSDSSNPTHMSTLAIVVATACSVLGVLLLIMVIMIFRRRKPRPPSRLCRQSSTPPPYSRVHNNDVDELDRYLLIGYENPNETPRVNLPSYEEAISCGQSRQDSVSRSDETQGHVGEYRPLPSIPGSFRANQMMSGENTSRHSIITTSTMNRDGVSELFGSIDTVNVSVSDASTAVTIETLDSATSHHSNMSRRATAGSIASENSNGSLVTEDVPLLDSTQREENDKSDDEGDGPNRDE